MRSVSPRRTLVSAGALAVALTLSGCGGDDPADNAPAPAKALPSPVQQLVVGTDVGQFLVTPKEGTAQADIDATVAKLRSMEGVQSAEFKDGEVDLQFRPFVTKEQRQAAVQQLAALGEVREGI